MAPQVASHGTARKHGEMLELAKKFFTEQQAFLDQVEMPQWGGTAAAMEPVDILKPRSFLRFRYPFEDPV